MVELTNEEKEMLDLTSERIEGLAVAEAAEKRTEMRSILNRFTDSLKSKARLIEDASEREKALSGIAEKGKAARKYIMEQLKTKPAKQQRAAQTQASGLVSNIMSLNLYNQGARVTSNQLLNQKIKGSIDVRSPKAEVMEELNVMLSPESKIGEALRFNLEKVKEVLEDRLETTEYNSFKIDINTYLGAIDVSKKKNRIEVYNYWAKIGSLYEQFEEDMANFFIEVRDIDWGEKTQSKFDDLSRRFNDLNLEYIAKFDNVDKKFESGYNRFFNAVSYKLAMDRMLTSEDNLGNYKDEKILQM